ncbi:MAG TPA: GFA family protein [Steroidobacteraceae bacterium]
MPTQQLSGRCLCGALRYTCAPPVSQAAFCHCESCRRAAGAHVVAWMTVPRSSFQLTSGTASQFASSPPVVRQFCGRCGSPVTYWNESSPETIDVTLATLDSPGAITPADHIWMGDAVAWDRVTDGRPQYRAGRP